jgi:hypothetical protein
LVTPVLGAASATSITVDAGAVGTPSITTTGDTNTGIFFPAADTIAFAEGGVEAARIDSSGNMLVGTTTNSGVDTGSQRLVVNGLASGGGAAICAIADSVGRGIRVTDSSKTNTAIYDMTTTLATLGTNQSIPLAFTTVGSERMRINSSGNLLVGTTSISAGRVNVLAAASASGIVVQVTNNGDYGLAFSNASGTNVGRIQIDSAATSYVTSSDYRLKNSISPMTGALAKVALLKPCTYKWNADNSDAEGFIAHELAEVCPQAVSGEKDAVDADGNIISQGIDTSFLVATLTAAIQEQQSLITALTARITALENK